MDTLTAARAQMEMSFFFHMIFAALGVAMPLLMAICEGLWLRTRRQHYLDLAQKWAKATALTFVIGAVSGTGLSFELGLLWPRFMAFAGSIIGSAFALEGYAFFVEAIFLGMYLYGWERLSPKAHWLAGIVVAISGGVSSVLVVGANAWMQTPSGFDVVDGKPTNIDPLAPFFNPRWPLMALHSTLSCYIAVGFAVAGVYAVGMLRGRRDAYHRSALAIALGMAAITAIVQPLSGDFLAQNVAHTQPPKLAAMEAHFETQRGAPLNIGGLPDPATGKVYYALRIPKGLSFLAKHDFNAEVQGLNDFPVDERPNVIVAHVSFQLMVGSAFAMIGLGLWFWLEWWRGRRTASPVYTRWLLLALALGSPLGFLALETGWIVTEVGRQPWMIYHVLRTRDGVTTASDVQTTFFVFTVLYLLLGIVLIILLRYLATGAPNMSVKGGLKEAPDAAS
jgi:cytochrome d ubiquinol oxidase subunit I